MQVERFTNLSSTGTLIDVPAARWVMLVQNHNHDLPICTLELQSPYGLFTLHLRVGERVPIPGLSFSDPAWRDDQQPAPKAVKARLFTYNKIDIGSQLTAAGVTLLFIEHAEELDAFKGADQQDYFFEAIQSADLTGQDQMIADFDNKNVPGLEKLPARGFHSLTLWCQGAEDNDFIDTYVVTVAELVVNGSGASVIRSALPVGVVKPAIASDPVKGTQFDVALSGMADFVRVRAWKMDDAGAGVTISGGFIHARMGRRVLPVRRCEDGGQFRQSTANDDVMLASIVRNGPDDRLRWSFTNHDGANSFTAEVYRARNPGADNGEDHCDYEYITGAAVAAGASYQNTATGYWSAAFLVADMGASAVARASGHLQAIVG